MLQGGFSSLHNYSVVILAFQTSVLCLFCVSKQAVSYIAEDFRQLFHAAQYFEFCYDSDAVILSY